MQNRGNFLQLWVSLRKGNSIDQHYAALYFFVGHGMPLKVKPRFM